MDNWSGTDGFTGVGGGVIFGWAYIWNNIFVGKWMDLYPGRGLKTGEALTWDFTVYFQPRTRTHGIVGYDTPRP